MRISANSYSQTLISRLQNLNASQLKYEEQLSTKQKVNKVSDDPASASKIQSLQAQQREAASLRTNLNTASSSLEFSTENMDFLRQMSQQVLEASASFNKSGTGEDLDATIQMLNDVLDQSLSVSNSSFLDEYVFAGDTVSTKPFEPTTDVDGNITAVTYMGSTTGSKTIEVAKGMDVNPTTGVSDNQSIESFLNGIIALRDSLLAGDDAAISTAMDDLEVADDGLVLAQSELGNKSQRLNIIQTLEDNLYNSRQDSISRLKDVDLNEVAVKFTQAQTAYQAALQSASSVLQLSLIDFV